MYGSICDGNQMGFGRSLPGLSGPVYDEGKSGLTAGAIGLFGITVTGLPFLEARGEDEMDSVLPRVLEHALFVNRL